ncbi:unnamed protein product [marine sediment metagenome]|uniref:Uncharacterized protein n=1 Tax=marine sediment metagenome TaxID=412755 RepID=X1TFW2_9ZZZZ
MITEAIINRVKYPPELIPDSWFGTVPLNAEVSPPVIDLRRFTPYILALANIRLTANANVVLRAKYDSGGRIRVEENTAAMLSNLIGAWWLSSKDILICFTPSINCNFIYSARTHTMVSKII